MNRSRVFGVALLTLACSGCAVVAVASAAVSVGATVVGTAVDVAVGAVQVTGKAIGSAVDSISGSGKPEPPPPGEPKRQQ